VLVAIKKLYDFHIYCDYCDLHYTTVRSVTEAEMMEDWHECPRCWPS